jgi:hypothetical protein
MSNEVTKLNEAFEKSGLTFRDRAGTLAVFKADHEIVFGEDGEPYSFFDGERQPLHSALHKFGAINRELIDGRSLPREKGGVTSKADLKDFKAKSDYISKFGGAAYEALPLAPKATSEVVYREDFHALDRPEKVRRIAADPDILSRLPARPTGQPYGAKVNFEALERQRKIRPGGRKG